MRLILLTIIIAIGWMAYGHMFKVEEILHPAGMLVATTPTQEMLTRKSWMRGEYRFQPTAIYTVKGRVLSTNRYFLERNSRIAPVDVVLGWKRMSDTNYLEHIDISQRYRSYQLSWDENVGMEAVEMFAESANMTLIPANDKIYEQVKALKIGQVVTISGYLVNVTAEDGFVWDSSVGRTDPPEQGSEIIWVDGLEVH